MSDAKAPLMSFAPCAAITTCADPVARMRPLVQDDDLVRRLHLVEEMGRPEHGEPRLRHELAKMPQDAGARIDVEADRRLVEDEEPGTM